MTRGTLPPHRRARDLLRAAQVACWVLTPATFGISLIGALPLTAAYFAMPFLFRKASATRAQEIRLLVAR